MRYGDFLENYQLSLVSVGFDRYTGNFDNRFGK